MSCRRTGLLLASACVLGCGSMKTTKEAAWDRDGKAAKTERMETVKAADHTQSMTKGDGKTGGTATKRKIIYRANIDLVVDDYPAAKKAINELVDSNQGYRANFVEDRSRGERLSGYWKVRIPAEAFDQFVQSLEKLGVPESVQFDTDDVTDRFVDNEARLRVKRKREEELLKLLGELKDKRAEDITVVFDKLDVVRTEIERIEGMLNLLNNQVSYTTVEIKVREEKEYVPPQERSFGEQISYTFAGSLDAMRDLGKGATLATVALGPWLPLLAVVLLPPVMVWRRGRRQRRARKPDVRTIPPASAGS